MSAIDNIIGLPSEIQEKIVSYLDPRNLCIASQVHPIWYDLTKNGLGKIWRDFVDMMNMSPDKLEICKAFVAKKKKEAEPEPTEFTEPMVNFKDICMFFFFRRSARLMWITWLNDTYWQIQSSPDSIFGEIAHLHSVCWLDVGAYFHIPFSGVYDVYWRLKLTHDAHINEPDLSIKSKIMNVSFRFSNEIQSQMRGKGWVYMKVARLNIGLNISGSESTSSSAPPQTARILNDHRMPIGRKYEILLGEEDINEEIQVRMFCSTGDWKRNLEVDFIEFVPIDFAQTDTDIEQSLLESDQQQGQSSQSEQSTSFSTSIRSRFHSLFGR